MLKAGLAVLAVVSMLLSSTVSADETEVTAVDNAYSPTTDLALSPNYSSFDIPRRWQRQNQPASSLDTSDWSSPFADVAFQDSGTLARVSRLRNLSLLTFAEVGQSRLFLGVNDEGLVGLHFRVFRRQNDGRYLEVARMPYLKASETDDE